MMSTGRWLAKHTILVDLMRVGYSVKTSVYIILESWYYTRDAIV